MAEDKARDRVPSIDSARARNAVFRPQGPAVARMDFFNGLLRDGKSIKGFDGNMKATRLLQSRAVVDFGQV